MNVDIPLNKKTKKERKQFSQSQSEHKKMKKKKYVKWEDITFLAHQYFARSKYLSAGHYKICNHFQSWCSRHVWKESKKTKQKMIEEQRRKTVDQQDNKKRQCQWT